MFRFFFFFVILVLPAVDAGQWALRNAKTGTYLFADGEQIQEAAQFRMNDPSFCWRYESVSANRAKVFNAAGDKMISVEVNVLPTKISFRYKNAEWIPEPVPQKFDLKGRGAKITWIEYQAEESETNGRIAGPVTDPDELASEAIGRMGVFLDNAGDFVAWTAQEKAAGFSVRYCIPDSPTGDGIDATLSLYVNDEKVETLKLTSRFSWIYGPRHRGARLWSNDPGNGDTAVKYFDTLRLLLKTPVNAGDRIMLRRDAEDNAPFYLIDMIELEDVPPALTKPEKYLSITDFGAVANDGKDDSAALMSALDAAARRSAPGVWIPAGVFDFEPPSPEPVTAQTEYQRFPLNNIHLAGAGMWHTELRGQGIAFSCNGSRIRVSDFAIDWQGTSRSSAILFFGKSLGEGSEFWNLYATHSSLLLSISDETSRGLIIRDSRIRSSFAGGINLRGGHRDAVMDNIHVRGTGDDGLILWAAGDAKAVPVRNCTIRNSTVEAPWIANGYLLAGGEGSRLENCVAKDIVRHSGVRVSTQIYITPTMPFSGKTVVTNVTLIRCGSEKEQSYNGALQLESHGHDVTGIDVSDIDVYSSPFSAVQVYAKIDGKQKSGKAVEAVLRNMNLHDALLHGVHLMNRTPGAVELKSNNCFGILFDCVKNDSTEMKLK